MVLFTWKIAGIVYEPGMRKPIIAGLTVALKVLVGK